MEGAGTASIAGKEREMEMEKGKGTTATPKWLPISLLAFSTVAMLGPVILFRKQIRALRSGGGSVEHVKMTNVNGTAPPPRRVANTSSSLPGSGSAKTQALPISPSLPSKPTIGFGRVAATKGAASAGAGAGAPKLFTASDTLKAFSYATAMVTAGAVGTVYAVKYSLDVRNTQEFSDRMREIITRKMPVLSSRLYGPLQEDPSELATTTATTGSGGVVQIDPEWNWEGAEKRMGEAYERGGVGTWAVVALEEVEKEEALERGRRQRQ